MSGVPSLFAWLPRQRAAAHGRVRARRSTLAGLGFVLAELGADLRRLAESCQAVGGNGGGGVVDDVMTVDGEGAGEMGREATAVDVGGDGVAREAAITARIADTLLRGSGFVTRLSGDELVSAWRLLEADTARACHLSNDSQRVARLRDTVAESERLQELVDRKLAEL